MLELGKNLREIRKNKALSAAELSQKSGVARSLISQLESGKRQSTSVDTLYRLAQALEVPIASLLTEEPLKPPRSGSSIKYKQSDKPPFFFKEQDLAYLSAIQKAKDAGVSPELLDELIDVVIRIKGK